MIMSMMQNATTFLDYRACPISLFHPIPSAFDTKMSFSSYFVIKAQAVTLHEPKCKAPQ